jgi:hypothetical protein
MYYNARLGTFYLVTKTAVAYPLCMIEMNSIRKNKINLSDYDYRRDIENRLLMAQFSVQDVKVLEEILYSPLTIPLRKLIKNLDLEESEVLLALDHLSKTRLFKIVDDTLVVDKDMRKYYESQISKFEDDFVPGMDYLQGLLKKPPIHVLPTWYNIPRASNNIFDSLVEKYLLTPQIFQRYLNELKLSDASISSIVQELFSSPDFKLTSRYVIEKYQLTREQFGEYMLGLEFNFVCCLGYQRKGDQIEEVITPFHEWRQYLRFLKDTEPTKMSDGLQVERRRPHDFSFVQDMGIVLTLAKKQPLNLMPFSERQWSLEKNLRTAIAAKFEGLDEEHPDFILYLNKILNKLKLLKLLDVVDGRLYALESANDWLDMRLENRALFIYRHPLNQLEGEGCPPMLCSDRLVRESEKSIQRVLNLGWVYFDDFCKGVLVPLTEESLIVLKRTGKTWKYSLPRYSDEERALLKASIFEGLFEVGIVATGHVGGRACFAVTPFGQSFFGK